MCQLKYGLELICQRQLVDDVPLVAVTAGSQQNPLNRVHRTDPPGTWDRPVQTDEEETRRQ